MENIYAALFEAASLSNSPILLSEFAVNEEHDIFIFLFVFVKGPVSQARKYRTF